ncbi:hypothetical protein S245_053276 [Arachis hypogaea]
MIFFEYPAYGNYVGPTTRSARPVFFFALPSEHVADPIPESPIVGVPNYPPWFNPEEDQVVPDIPMPDAPPHPKSFGSAPSTEYSSEVWIDQMMADLFSSSFETGDEDSTEDGSSSNITGMSE